MISDPHGWEWSWMDSIFPYLKNVNMLKCPSGRQDKMAANGRMYAGYGYNFGLVGGSTDGIFVDEGKAHLYTLSEMKNPASTVFVCDCIQWKSGFTNGAPLLMCPTMIHWLMEKDANKDNFIPAYRHNEGMNYTFCDGHAKYYKSYQGPGKHASGNGAGQTWWDPTLGQD